MEDVAQLVEHLTGTPLTHVQLPGAARDFPPESTFSADSLMVSIHTQCAFGCINIYVHSVHLDVLTSMCMLKILQSMSRFS